jgi:hypothetical protein
MYQRIVAKNSFESKLEDRRKVGSPILRRLEDAEDYILEPEVTGWRETADNKEQCASLVK